MFEQNLVGGVIIIVKVYRVKVSRLMWWFHVLIGSLQNGYPLLHSGKAPARDANCTIKAMRKENDECFDTSS